MNIITSLKSIFPQSGTEEFVSEKFSTFGLGYVATWPSTTSISAIQECLSQIPERDHWELAAQIGGDTVPISSNADLAKDSHVLEESARFLVDQGDFTLNLSIEKGKDGGEINIYSFSQFDHFAQEVGPLDLLESLAKDATASSFLRFQLLDDEGIDFYSRKFQFGPASAPRRELPEYIEISSDKSCDFNRRYDLPFSPDAFRLISRGASPSNVERVLDSLFSLFVVADIFDSVFIQEDRVRIRLSGFKIYQWELELRNFSLESAETYWEIYEWIYSEPTKVTDKLGLARNILSSYLKDDSLEIEESAFQALVSGYKVYLKENLSEYLDLRSKMHDELSEISKKASEVVGEFFSNYQKSSATILSFFITVFVVRFFTAGRGDEVFNREATILTFCFLALSLVYLIISLIILWKEKSRLKTRYERLKGRFLDLLHENDIKAILSNDQEYNDEVDFIKARRFWYAVLWILTVLSLLSVVLTLSSYVNWVTIKAAIMSLRQ